MKMRKELKRLGTKSFYSFTACVAKKTMLIEGISSILVRDVRLKGKRVTKHVWLKLGKSFSSLNIEPGMFIRFKSRVIMYAKINHDINGSGKIVNYGLSSPVYLEVITEKEHFLK